MDSYIIYKSTIYGYYIYLPVDIYGYVWILLDIFWLYVGYIYIYIGYKFMLVIQHITDSMLDKYGYMLVINIQQFCCCLYILKKVGCMFFWMMKT